MEEWKKNYYGLEEKILQLGYGIDFLKKEILTLNTLIKNNDLDLEKLKELVNIHKTFIQNREKI